MRTIWIPRFVTALLWFLAAGCFIYWLLLGTARAKPHRLLANAQLAQLQAPLAEPATQTLALALGAQGQAPSRQTATEEANGSANSGLNFTANRYQLSGILAQGNASNGLVMLRVDGKPVPLLRLGSTVEPGVVVQSVQRQSVTLAYTDAAENIQTLSLELGKPNAASSSATPLTSSSASAPSSPADTHVAANISPTSTGANTASGNTMISPELMQERTAAFAERMRERRANRQAQNDSATPPTEQANDQAANRTSNSQGAASAAPNAATNTAANAPANNPSNRTQAATPSPAPTAVNLIEQSRLNDDNLYFK